MEDFTMDDLSAMKAEMVKMQNEAANGGNGNPLFWKPKELGQHTIRFIAPMKKTFGEKVFFQHQKVHYVNGRRFLCLNQKLTDKEGVTHMPTQCPICQRTIQLYKIANKNKDAPEYKKAGKISAKERYITRILVRGKKDENGKDDYSPLFYEFGKTIFEWLSNQIQIGEIGNFLSSTAGLDLYLIKKQDGKEVKYDCSFSRNNTPILDPNTCKEAIKQLPEKLSKMSYDNNVEFATPEEMVNALKEFEAEFGKLPGFVGGQTTVDPALAFLNGGSGEYSIKEAPAQQPSGYDASKPAFNGQAQAQTPEAETQQKEEDIFSVLESF